MKISFCVSPPCGLYSLKSSETTCSQAFSGRPLGIMFCCFLSKHCPRKRVITSAGGVEEKYNASSWSNTHTSVCCRLVPYSHLSLLSRSMSTVNISSAIHDGVRYIMRSRAGSRSNSSALLREFASIIRCEFNVSNTKASIEIFKTGIQCNP